MKKHEWTTQTFAKTYGERRNKDAERSGTMTTVSLCQSQVHLSVLMSTQVENDLKRHEGVKQNERLIFERGLGLDQLNI